MDDMTFPGVKKKRLTEKGKRKKMVLTTRLELPHGICVLHFFFLPASLPRLPVGGIGDIRPILNFVLSFP